MCLYITNNWYNMYIIRYNVSLFTLYLLLVYTTFALTVITSQSITQLLSNNYNWDIDHEMYFGFRLLHGEPLYAVELHDKLPIVQILFTIPAYFQSVFLFKVICFIFTIFTTVVIYFQIKIYNFHGYQFLLSRIISIALCVLYVQIISIQSIYHITTISVNCFIISMIHAINHYYLKREQNGTYINIWRGFVPVFFMSCAISIRPYFLVPSILLMSGIFLIRRTDIAQKKLFNNIFQRFTYVALFLLVLCIMVFMLNFPPYIVTENPDKLIIGIAHNLQILQPSSWKNILQQEYMDIFYYLYGLYGIIISILFSSIIILVTVGTRQYKRLQNQKINLFFIISISGLSLEFSILQRHYWTNYIAMFAPFMVYILWICAVETIRHNFLGRQVLAMHSKHLMVSLLLTFVITVNFTIHTTVSDHHSDDPILNYIIEYKNIHNIAAENFQFLAANSMYIHWKLLQSRHGFPHAANIEHIDKGFWKDIKYTLPEFPYTTHSMCSRIEILQLDIIIVKKYTGLSTCFADKTGDYSQHDIGESIIFEKNRVII